MGLQLVLPNGSSLLSTGLILAFLSLLGKVLLST